MKKLTVLFLTLLLSSSMAFANEIKPEQALRMQIVNMLKNNKFQLDQNFARAEVTLLVNDKNEIVIVSIHSQNKALESFVKSKLNYKKVTIDSTGKMKIYKMPLKIVKK